MLEAAEQKKKFAKLAKFAVNKTAEQKKKFAVNTLLK